MIGGVKFMRKIVISIQNSTLIFSYKTSQAIREDLMNTNIISDSELVFSDDYIIQNKKLVLPFFEELCEMNSIDTISFQNNNLANFLIDLFTKIKIRKVKVKKQENATFELCEKLIQKKGIKEFECFNLPSFLLEMLDNKGIKVITHSEIFYISPFMQQNEMNDYSKIYYQKKIKFYHKLNDEDKDDFFSFLKINHYLKLISMMEFYRGDLEFILESLKTFRVKNVYIEIHENITIQEDFIYLRELNKKYKKEKIEIGLVYSENYLQENLMKQITINTLRLCGFLLACFLIGIVGYVSLNNYHSLKEVSQIQQEVKNAIDNSDNIALPPDIIEEEFTIKNRYIAALLSINPDVVGYLKINNTNVDYPVVLKDDNKYYLKKNLYNEDDQNGWIFMDYRNSDKILNDNTIIYGHNMYYSGVMFGTLHRTLNYSWNSNPENMILSFDTMYESMKWQIFSIYTIPKTSDYLKVSFETPELKDAYISMTKGRSIRNFGVDVTSSDYLLTLSTCTGDNERLVIHAKLIVNTESSIPDSSDT